jgi:UDP-glucose 4-epimerase
LKVLVIGGLGFVGSAICHSLHKLKDINLAVIDNQSKGSLKNIQGVDCHFLPIDITDRTAVEQVIAKENPEIVIHLAAIHFIPDCNRDTVRCLATNIVGTENILQACAQKGSVKRVIITSSQAVYPIKDSPNKEEDVPYPYDVYGESKLANEFQAMRFQRDAQIDTIAVRLSNVYGPRETNPHVIPEIMTQLVDGKRQVSLGNIEPKRDFVHSTDVARAYAALALQPTLPGFHLVNLGSGNEYSIRDILAKLSEIIGKEITYIKDPSRFRSTERMHLVPDISRIRELVGWRPQVSIDQGLKDLCEWYGLC